jgi:hypothetical protein
VTNLAVLAAGGNSTSTISDVEPGLLGFLVLAALAVALVFLLRSMNKQFRKIGPRPEDIEAEVADEAEAPEDGPGSHAVDSAADSGRDATAARAGAPDPQDPSATQP